MLPNVIIPGMDLLEILMHPVTAIVLSLVLGAIAASGKFSRAAADIMVAIAGAVGAYAVMRSGPKDPRVKIAWICAIGFVTCMISLWINPSKPKVVPQQSDNAISTPPPQPIDSEALARKLVEGLKSSTPHVRPRAHLHVTKFEWNMPQVQGGHAEVKVIFENNGNAPIRKLIFRGGAAFYVYPQGQIEGMRSDDQRIFEERLFSNVPTLTEDLINQSDNEMPAGVDRSFTIKSPPWEQMAIDKFREGKAVVYATGILTYSDEHSILETKFCVFTEADGNMRFCHKYNTEP